MGELGEKRIKEETGEREICLRDLDFLRVFEGGAGAGEGLRKKGESAEGPFKESGGRELDSGWKESWAETRGFGEGRG